VNESFNFYNEHAEQFIENTLNVDMSSLYSEFTAYLPKNAKVLDAGCGSGRDSLAFLKMGYDVSAFDASNEMVKYASKLTGISVKKLNFDQLKSINTYDGIWCCASLLHVQKSELLESMQSLANALKEHGVWYVSFKYGDTEREKDGRRFTDLNENLLHELAGQLSDIEIISTWVTTDKRANRDEKWLNSILKKRQF
jgi:SAM-dependent methyltransferase